MSLPDWARAHGDPLFAARIRARPVDFEVTEELGFELSGDGEHDYLFIEKTAANTDWVLRQLAVHAGVPAKDVGCAGLKDRHAVTRQWFSVPRWHAPNWGQLDIEGVRLLEQHRHNRKLRRGAHKGNRFRIVLRAPLPDEHSLQARLTLIASAGVPNYFGEQRFGRGASNIALADAWSEGRRLQRHKRSLAISAARSFLFNSILDARVRERTWDKLVAGDVANLDGTGSVFEVSALDDELVNRCAEMDIHPAGPLCGESTSPESIPAGRENWQAALQKARVKAAHRGLRLRVANFEWSTGQDSLELRFVLGRGGFATAVLREIAQVEDAKR